MRDGGYEIGCRGKLYQECIIELYFLRVLRCISEHHQGATIIHGHPYTLVRGAPEALTLTHFEVGCVSLHHMYLLCRRHCQAAPAWSGKACLQCCCSSDSNERWGWEDGRGAQRCLRTHYSKRKSCSVQGLKFLSFHSLTNELQSGPHSTLILKQGKVSNDFQVTKSSGQLSVLILVVLSAALDTVDHSTLCNTSSHSFRTLLMPDVFLLLSSGPSTSAPWPLTMTSNLGLLYFLFILTPLVLSSCITTFQTPSICYCSKVLSVALIWPLNSRSVIPVAIQHV